MTRRDAAPPAPLAAAAMAALLLLLACAGCGGQKSVEPAKEATPAGPPPPLRIVEMVSQTGGTHYRTMMRGGRWYQTFSNELLVLDPRSGAALGRLRLAEPGSAGPAVDAAFVGDTLLIVQERSAVVAVDVSVPESPRLAEVVDAATLGVAPHRVSVVGGEAWIGGEGGVVRWNDRRRWELGADLAASDGTPVARAVVQAAAGPAACVGRRVLATQDGAYLGAATDLIELPPDAGAPLAFSLQSREGAAIGLMSRDIRELDSTAVPGIVRRLRWTDGRLWVVTDTEILSFAVADGRLGDRRSIRVKGARDVDRAGPNTLAVGGSFGRALYREQGEPGAPGDTFYAAHREPSRLSRAIADGRRILAGSDEGNWLYRIGDDAQLSDRQLEAFQLPSVSDAITGVWGEAKIAPDGRSVIGTVDGQRREYRSPTGGLVYCLRAVDRDIWIGHEFGIDVLQRGADGGISLAGSLALDGPVRYLFPKWDGGVAYVAEFGGFGVARIRELAAPGTIGPDGQPVAQPSAPDDGPTRGGDR